MKKSNLDEMQEQKMLQIERNGYWLAYQALLAAIVIQGILGADFWQMIGELVVLLIICIHVVAGCLRHGLWDRKLKPNWKTNLLASLVCAAIVAMTIYFMLARKTEDTALTLNLTLIISAAAFVLCFGALTICAKLYKKRREELDDE